MNTNTYYIILRYIVLVLLCVATLTVSAKKSKEKQKQQDVVLADSVSGDTLLTLSADSAVLTVPALTKADSLTLNKLAKETMKQKRDWARWNPNPKRALWLALVIPGAGQIYNRKYWKLPIVYGGFIGCAYAMRWNNQMYMDYSQAYLDIMDDDPSTKSYTQFLHLGAEITPANEARYKMIFKSRKDRYRRWRDLSFFCMLGVYALSVIDAYVDAQLSKFDISDDLSLRLEPAVINGGVNPANKNTAPVNIGVNTSALGVHGALTF